MLIVLLMWGVLTAATVAFGLRGRRRPVPDPFDVWLESLNPGDLFVTPRGIEIPIGRLSAGELHAFLDDIESLPETKEI